MPPDFALNLDRLSATLAAGAVALTGLGSITCALAPAPLPPEFEVLLGEARRLSPPMQAVVLQQFVGGLDRRQQPIAMARLREACVSPAEAPAPASDTLASDTLAALFGRLDPRVCELVVEQLLPADPLKVPPGLLAQYLSWLDPVQRDVAVGRLNQWRAPALSPADPLARLAPERLAQWVTTGLVDQGGFSPAPPASLPPPEPPPPDVPKRPAHRPPTERIRIDSMIEADLKSGQMTIEGLRQTKLASLQSRYCRSDRKEAARRSVKEAIAQVVERHRPQ